MIVSPFVMEAPHCVALRWMINRGASGVTAGWYAIGVVLVTGLALT